MDVDTIVVLEGDETGQELLEEAVRVLAPDVIGFELNLPRFDLSLAARRETDNAVVHEAAAAIREHGLGLKAATVTPEGPGGPNRQDGRPGGPASRLWRTASAPPISAAMRGRTSSRTK